MPLNPRSQLAYFTEWGGRSWEVQVRSAIGYLEATGGLEGMELLEIGTRYGKMALLFSLLGAHVTAIDISTQALSIAQHDTAQWLAEHGAELTKPPHSIQFVGYDGNLDLFADGSFDIVFTKSVLVVVPGIERFLARLAAKLRPGGRIVFLENAKGHPALHAARALRHRRWDYRQAHYFEQGDIQAVRRRFQVDAVHESFLPPIYGILGRKT
jgi:SAM-dependent methyltransferase